MANRLGTIALEGVIASVRLCINDHQSLGTDFIPSDWDWLDKAVESNVIQFEIDRLDNAPHIRELREVLMPKFTDAVWPHWREDQEAKAAHEAELAHAEQEAKAAKEEADRAAYAIAAARDRAANEERIRRFNEMRAVAVVDAPKPRRRQHDIAEVPLLAGLHEATCAEPCCADVEAREEAVA